ncbi:MAG: hypothetical protein ACT4OS_00745 [Acidimicrobiales bacterium]
MILEFTDSLAEAAGLRPWHLWVYGSDWELLSPEAMAVPWFDDSSLIDNGLEAILDEHVSATELSIDLHLRLVFSSSWELAIRGNSDPETSDLDLWLLFTPNSGVITVRPNLQWTYELEEAEPS